jgi:hypothetical protein
MAGVVGSLAITIVTKLQNIAEFCRFDVIASFITSELFGKVDAYIDYGSVVKSTNLMLFICLGLILSIIWA